MRPQSKFQVGDQVRITSAQSCIFGCNDEMLAYINCEGVILAREWDRYKQAHAYRLDIDECRFMWCINCLEAVQSVDIEESDASLDVLLS